MWILGLLAFAGILTTTTAQGSTGKLGNAAKNLQNPPGAAYQATLPASGPVQGSIVAVAIEGQGVNFAVSFSNLPKQGGPFPFHIHAAPVPPDGNCTGALAHLDPYIRGETPPCDALHPETCQVGDLSGKYGKAGTNGSSYSTSFIDPFVSLQPGLGAFFGNRSFVLHYGNTTRITCANFTSIGSGSPNSTGGNSTSMTRTPTPMSTAPAASTSAVAGAAATTSLSNSSSPQTVSTSAAGRLSAPASVMFLTAALMLFCEL